MPVRASKRLSLSPVDLTILFRLYKIPGLTAKEVGTQVPGGVTPRNIRYSVQQLRNRKLVKRGSPYRRNRNGPETFPLYITKKGERWMAQHLEDMFRLELPK